MCPRDPSWRLTRTATSSGVRKNLWLPWALEILVVVETEDALLLCPRDRAQDAGKVVKWLETQKLSHLL